MPIISVIVPVYKVEPYLHRCADSILAQTFTDFELILVDDGSPDNCGAICDEYAEQDSRIHVIHQENGGLSAARNAGIEWAFANSDSEWISFIDSDDWVHQRYLELLYEAANRYEANISQCLHIKTNGTEELPAAGEKIVEITPEEQYTDWYAAFAWGKMYRKECFRQIRYPIGKIYEDVAIWYKLLFAEEKLALVQETLYYYFVRDDSIIGKPWTPARYAQMEAWDAQLQFLKEYGNEQVLECAGMHYVQIMALHLRKIDKSGLISAEEKLYYRKCIKRKLRRELLRNWHNPRIQKEKMWYLELAFPCVAWIYWTWKGVAGRIRRG